MLKKMVIVTLVPLVIACATSPLGRKQFIAVPDSTMDAMGAQSFKEMESKTPTISDPAVTRYVHCIIEPLLAVADQDPKQWEIQVFKDSTANAFALPGRKIGVHTGILTVATNDGQLAAVVGHEIGHVLARHGAERMSQGLATQGGLMILNAYVQGKEISATQKAAIMGLAGVGTTVGVMLPFSRSHESEADLIGLDLMARAGFDPRQSVELWKNMSKAAGKAPPEFLSTHPANDTRMNDLQAHMSEALGKADAAHRAGRNPVCKR